MKDILNKSHSTPTTPDVNNRGGFDRPLGTTSLGADPGDHPISFPPVGPDGVTPLHMSDTTTRTLIGGSRYVGWMENLCQGALFDRIARQSFYIYGLMRGKPEGQSEVTLTWYARDLHEPMPDWVDTLSEQPKKDQKGAK